MHVQSTVTVLFDISTIWSTDTMCLHDSYWGATTKKSQF